MSLPPLPSPAPHSCPNPTAAHDRRRAASGSRLRATLIGLGLAASALAGDPGQNPTAEPPLAGRVATVATAAQRLDDWTELTRRALAGPGAPAPPDLAAAIAAADKARADSAAEVDRLKRLEEEARDAVRVGQEAEKDLESKIQDWTARLARARATLDDLTREESELRARLRDRDERDSAFSEGVASGDRTPHEVVMIRNGRVAPVEPPYFEITSIVFRQSGAQGVKVEPKQQGIPLGAALEDGGWLAKSLAKTDPAKHFVLVLVTDDSIPTYYALRTELRKRRLLHAWGVWDGTCLVAGGDAKNSDIDLH